MAKKKKKYSKSRVLGKKLHNCGNGFQGEIIKTKGVTFCGFCGKEFSNRLKANV